MGSLESAESGDRRFVETVETMRNTKISHAAISKGTAGERVTLSRATQKIEGGTGRCAHNVFIGQSIHTCI